jgi:hypothetical protein
MASNDRNMGGNPGGTTGGVSGGVRYADRQKRAAEATLAVKEADAETRRVDEKTQRLRALRLAKVEADAKELAANPPKAKKARAKPKAKAAASSIAVEDLNAEDDG